MERTKKRAGTTRAAALCLVALGLFGPVRPSARAQPPLLVGVSRGQMVYVPAYSHIYSGDRERPFYVTVTLSIRNTDPSLPLRLVTVEYRGSDGRLLRNLVQTPLTLGPLSSTRYVIQESDKRGGSGASFLVTWRASTPTRPMSSPLLETVMIGTKGQQGVSFTSRGQIVRELTD